LDTAGRSYKSEFEKFENIFNTFEEFKDGSIQELNQQLAKFKVRGANAKFPWSKFEARDSCWEGKNLWFLKATRFNRGRGIFVFNSLEMLKKQIQELIEGCDHENQLAKEK